MNKVWLIILVLMLALTGCGGDNNDSSNATAVEVAGKADTALPQGFENGTVVFEANNDSIQEELPGGYTEFEQENGLIQEEVLGQIGLEAPSLDDLTEALGLTSQEATGEVLVEELAP